MSVVRFKECPRCGLRTSLETPTCEQCGRQFKTQFIRGVTVPPGEPLAVAPLRPVPSLPSESDQFGAMLAECSSQYHAMTWYWILSVFLVPAVVGIFLCVAFVGKEMSLRQKVASLGVNAAAWENSLRPQRIKTFALVFGIPIALVIGLFLLLSAMSHLPSRDNPGPRDATASQPSAGTAPYAAAADLTLGEDQGQVSSALGGPLAVSPGRNDDGTPNGFQTWHYSVDDGGDLWLILRDSQVVRIYQTDSAGRPVRLERSPSSPL